MTFVVGAAFVVCALCLFAVWLYMLKMLNRAGARTVLVAAAVAALVAVAASVLTGGWVWLGAAVCLVVVAVMAVADGKVLVDRAGPDELYAPVAAAGGERRSDIPDNLGALWDLNGEFVLFATFDTETDPAIAAWAASAVRSLQVAGGELRLVAVVDGAELAPVDAGPHTVLLCAPESIVNIVSPRATGHKNRRARRAAGKRRNRSRGR